MMDFKIEGIATVKGGKRLPKGYELIDSKTPHPYIRARDIKNGKVNFNEPKYIDETTFQKISRYIVSQSDVIITIVGANIGDVAYINSEFHNANLTENAVKISVDQNIVYSKYLYYYLNQKDMKQYFQLVASGAAQGKLGLYKIKTTPVSLPPVPIQRKIAKILSNYDDLIENNLKRIKLLEESARLTYEEWFLRFRIDGKKLDIDPETSLPFGWLNKSFGDVFNINNGYAFKSGGYVEHGVPILRTRDYSQTKWIKIDQPIYISEELSQKYTKYYVQEYDLMLIMVGASIGNYGVVLPNDTGLLQNQNQWAIRVNNGFEKYIFYKLLMMEDLIKNLLTRKTGAARDFFRASFLKELDILLPDEDTVTLLNKTVQPTFEEINNLQHQNQLLKEARDILLPRLMTGMIDTDDMDIAV